MKRTLGPPVFPLLPAVAFCATLAFSPAAMGASPVVKVDGSSAVYPITEAAAQEFQVAKLHEVHVNVGVSGTSAGFTKFCAGETDITNASRPILKKEIDECAKAGVRFYEMPLAYDALTVVVNPQNSFVISMSVAELRKLWEPKAQGKINTWKDLNPAWPAQKINLYAPGANSGTFESFTEVVVGTSKSSRSDVSRTEDHGVLAQRIAEDKDGLGYLSLDYYVENQKKLKAVAISDGKGAVMPTVENIRDGSYQPLSRPVFIYVNEKSLEKPAVKEFVEYFMKNGARLVQEANYLPLPAKAYTSNLERMNAKKVGSVHGGENKARPRTGEMMKLLDTLTF